MHTSTDRLLSSCSLILGVSASIYLTAIGKSSVGVPPLSIALQQPRATILSLRAFVESTFLEGCQSTMRRSVSDDTRSSGLRCRVPISNLDNMRKRVTVTVRRAALDHCKSRRREWIGQMCRISAFQTGRGHISASAQVWNVIGTRHWLLSNSRYLTPAMCYRKCLVCDLRRSYYQLRHNALST